MSNEGLLTLALWAIPIVLLSVQVWSQRRRGKSWREIREEYTDYLGLTGLFGGKGRKD